MKIDGKRIRKRSLSNEPIRPRKDAALLESEESNWKSEVVQNRNIALAIRPSLSSMQLSAVGNAWSMVAGEKRTIDVVRGLPS